MAIPKYSKEKEAAARVMEYVSDPARHLQIVLQPAS